MSELNKEQIITALKICSTPGTSCDDCPYFGKSDGLTTCALLLMRDCIALIPESK